LCCVNHTIVYCIANLDIPAMCSNSGPGQELVYLQVPGLPPAVQLCAEAKVTADSARVRKVRAKRMVSFEMIGCGWVASLVGWVHCR
jgi:hypothetical protein